VNVNVSLYSTLSHSASNALGAPNILPKQMRLQQATEAEDAEVWIGRSSPSEFKPKLQFNQYFNFFLENTASSQMFKSRTD